MVKITSNNTALPTRTLNCISNFLHLLVFSKIFDVPSDKTTTTTTDGIRKSQECAMMAYAVDYTRLALPWSWR